jgi:hypothetical protein
MLNKMVVIAIMIGLSIVSAIFAGDSIAVRTIGSWPYGSCQSIALATISGHRYAIMGAGMGIYVLDINNPAQPPAKLSELPFYGDIRHIAVQGAVAFVLADSLYAVDLTVPQAPKRISVCKTLKLPRHFVLVGQYAYVIDQAGLCAVDIHDPSNPAVVKTLDSLQSIQYLCAAGDTLLASTGDSLLIIIDVSAPPAMVRKGFYSIGRISGMAVSDSLICTFYGDEFRTPASGVFETCLGVTTMHASSKWTQDGYCQYFAYSYARSACITDNRLFVAGRSGLLIYQDAAHFSLSSVADTCDSVNFGSAVTVDGDRAYVADARAGLAVFNVGSSGPRGILSRIRVPQEAYCVAVDSKYVYLGSWYSGFTILDAADPGAVVEKGRYNAGEIVMSIAVSDSVAYLSALDFGFITVDVSDPQAPKKLGACFTNNEYTMYGLALSGTFAYATAWEQKRLFVIDVKDPSHPDPRGSCALPGVVGYGVCVRTPYAYVALADSGIGIVDISDPDKPVLKATCPLSCVAYAVAVSGNYAFVAGGGGGMKVVDITDPLKPTYAASCPLPLFAEDIKLAGQYAYVAVENGGVHVIDISDPTSPSVKGVSANPGRTFGVAVSGDRIYAAAYNAGLQIGQVSGIVGIGSQSSKASLSRAGARLDYSRGKILYTLDRQSHVTLRVLDLAGRSAGLLERGVRAAGVHAFNAASLSNGAWLAVMETGKERIVKPFLVIK